MDSGKRFKAFTIITVTCRFPVTVIGFVEGQPQQLAKNITKLLLSCYYYVYFEHKSIQLTTWQWHFTSALLYRIQSWPLVTLFWTRSDPTRCVGDPTRPDPSCTRNCRPDPSHPTRLDNAFISDAVVVIGRKLHVTETAFFRRIVRIYTLACITNT